MSGIKIKVYAKVNLSLNISGIRSDGMHELDTVMTSVDIADVITVRLKGGGETVVTYGGGLTFKNDTALKASRLLRDAYPHFCADIFIEKKIPLSAGLGGSSADAAGVIFAIDKIFELESKGVQIVPTALKAGSDVPYLLSGGFARVKNTGDSVENFFAKSRLFLVVCKDRSGVSTAQSYQKFDALYPEKKYCPSDNDGLVAALKNGDAQAAARYIHNALQKGSCELNPSVLSTLSSVKETNCLTAVMSGSGSACIGLYENAQAAAEAEKRLRQKGLYAKAAETKEKGIEIITVYD